VIAWGRGPRPGRARLYWANTTVSGCTFDDHRLSIAWSDDEGETWSPLWTLMSVPATGEGGYPDLAVDRNPDSPAWGTVYAAINWFASPGAEPGFRLVASPDHGATWDEVEVPPIPEPAGFPFAYRIGYRLRPLPDGGLATVFHQVDATDASRARQGRAGFGFAHVRYDRDTGRFSVRDPIFLRPTRVNGLAVGTTPAPGTTDTLRLRPRWTVGLDADPGTGRLLVALADVDVTPRPGRARGSVRVGRSDDSGRSWRWSALPPLPAVAGRPVSAHKPALAVYGGVVVVGVHGLVDLPVGTDPDLGAATIGTAVTISMDGGETFGALTRAGRTRWDLEALARRANRAGLRDRMDVTADGRVVWAYADARPGPGDRPARIRAAYIELGPPPVVAPVPGPGDARARHLPR
jgi:hypothetical protein